MTYLRKILQISIIIAFLTGCSTPQTQTKQKGNQKPAVTISETPVPEIAKTRKPASLPTPTQLQTIFSNQQR